MTVNTKGLKTDVNNKPVGQSFNPLIDDFEPTYGRGNSLSTHHGKWYQVGSGASTTSIPVLTTSGLPILLSPSAQSQMNGATLEIEIPISNPSSAPTLATATTGGSLPAATYYVKYTWVDANGETQASPEVSITTTGSTSTVTATIPALPAGVTSANVYISTTSGSETKQGNTTSTTYTQTAALVAGSALPTSNTAGSVLERAIVTAVSSSGTLTLDGALSAAPSQGASFLLSPPDQTQLTGSNATIGNVGLNGRDVQEVFAFNALAITDTGVYHYSPSLDLSAFKKITVVAYSTLDQPVDVMPVFDNTQYGSNVYVGSAWTTYSTSARNAQLGVSGLGSHCVYLLNSYFTELDDRPFIHLGWVANCPTAAPTQGSLTLKIWGVPN